MRDTTSFHTRLPAGTLAVLALSFGLAGALRAQSSACMPSSEKDPVAREAPHFRRGDSNGDGRQDISDALATLSFLFLGRDSPGCLDAADTNDDGAVDITDAIRLLAFLFLGAAPPPGGLECGPDETPDGLDCRDPSPCAQTADPPDADELDLLSRPPPEIPPGARLPSTPTRLAISLAAGRPRLLGPEGEGSSVREERLQADGTWSVEEGKSLAPGRPGAPDIARRVVDVLLPFDADVRTLNVWIDLDRLDRRLLPVGPLEVRRVGEVGYYDPESERVRRLLADELYDSPGDDTFVEGRDELWPPHVVDVVGFSSRRQYLYVRLLFSPFQWNPRTQQLFEIRDVALTLSWERSRLNPASAAMRLSDPARIEERETSFYNWLAAREWYDLAEGFEREGSYDYVIITSRSVKTNCSQLSSFKTHKEGQGHTVAILSVETIEAFYPAPERADSMREFLRDKYQEWGIEWLLLVGDPDPYDQCEGAADAVGSVPMKMAWPRGDGYLGLDEDGEAVYGFCPTDHYFGDLSADWDVDGDGYAASSDDYDVVSVGVHAGGSDYYVYRNLYGLDFDMELKVGRIPFDDVSRIDAVLDRTIQYQVNSSSPSSGRSRVYLACSFLDSSTDTACLGRQLHHEVLDPLGLSTFTFYQDASIFSASHTLENTALIDEWQSRSAGLVLWAGHGSSTRTRIGYEEGGVEHWDGTIMDTASAPGLVDGPDPFVFQTSCSNGRPEYAENLAHTMLHDSAVGTVAASRHCYYTVGQDAFGSSHTCSDVAYRAMKWVANGSSAGRSMQIMRETGHPGDDWWMVHNLLTFNFYGDPKGRFQH
ncbi:MAG: hypothetical protein JXA90_12770 [Planctomycetes bacterium]|nr:hypothetical protein [Planctomycetota bacterium]